MAQRIDSDLTGRDNNFGLLRLFGALLVLYGHSFVLAGKLPPEFVANTVSAIGVKLFFSISGYLITLSWLKDPDPFRYLQRRALRIFPALIVVVLLSALVLGPLITRLPLVEYFLHPATWDYLRNAALYINYSLPGVFEMNTYPNAVNGSLWSLPIEVAMYLAIPVVLAFPSLRRQPGYLFVAAITFIGFAIWQTRTTPIDRHLIFYATDVSFGLVLAPYFVVGMMIAAAGPHVLNMYAGFAGLFVMSVVEVSAPIKEAMLILVLPYASLAFGIGPSLRLLPKGLDISYGMFLFGFPIQQVVSLIFGGAIEPWLLFLLTLSICTPIATLSWMLVEKPCLLLKPSGVNRAGVAEGAALDFEHTRKSAA